MRVIMLECINFYSGLNIYGTISDLDSL